MDTHKIEKYWSNFFGIKKEELKSTGVIVVPHNFLRGYNGAWIFRHNEKIIISVLPEMVIQISNKTDIRRPKVNDIFSEEYVHYLFGEKTERIIGPVYQGYYKGIGDIKPISKQVLELSYKEHSKLINKLSNSGDNEGWSNSGISNENDGIYGYYYDNNIESIGCYSIIEGDAGFIGVYTNPKYRGMGFSQEVLKKMVTKLSTMGKLVRYQTLKSNKPSIKIAAKIGFKEYATNIAIRFKKKKSN